MCSTKLYIIERSGGRMAVGCVIVTVGYINLSKAFIKLMLGIFSV